MIAHVPTGMSIVVMDVRLKPGVKQVVAEKIAAGECLRCDCKSERLGLCAKHYHQFRWALLNTPPDEHETFRAQLIREGKLLRSRQGQKLDRVNEFREAAG